MGIVVNDQNRMDRLNAMAQGGSAGVDSWEAAQQAQQRIGQNALDSTLGNSEYGLNAAQRDQLAGVLHARQSPAIDVANSGVGQAQRQVGYNNSAIASYLAQNQRANDEKNFEMQQHLSTLGLQHNLATQEMEARKAGMLNSLTSRNSLAAISGVGDAMQAQSGETDKNAALATAGMFGASAYQADGSKPSGLTDAQIQQEIEQGPQSLIAPIAAQLAAGHQNAGSMFDPGSYITDPQQEALLRQRDAAVAARDTSLVDRTSAPYQNAIANYLRPVDPMHPELGTAPVSSFDDPNMYRRAAAEQMGMDPFEAQGRFPNDTGKNLTRLQDEEKAQLYSRTGNTGGQAAVEKEKLDQATTQTKLEDQAIADQLHFPDVTSYKKARDLMGGDDSLNNVLDSDFRTKISADINAWSQNPADQTVDKYLQSKGWAPAFIGLAKTMGLTGG